MTQNPPDPQNPGGEQPNEQQPGGFPPPSQPSNDQPPSYGSPNQPPADQPPADQPPANQPPSYGAPQQPGYGTPPPPPPGGGFPSAPPPPSGQYGQYGAPQYGGPAGPWGGGQPQFSVGAAISYGWNAFKSNAGVWIGAFLAVAVISVVLQSLLNPAVNVDLDSASSGGGIPVVAYTFGGQLLAGLASIVTYLLSAVLVQGAVHKVNGRFEGFSSFTNFTHAGPLFVAAAALGVVSLVLGLLSIVSPFLTTILNLVWGVLSVFTLYVAADRGLQVVDAVKESFRIVTSNLGSVVVLWLATIGLVIAGVIVICFTGLIIVIPLMMLAWAFAYKTLSGQQVAAP